MALYEPPFGIPDRYGHAREASTRPARRSDCLLRSRIAAVFLRGDVHHHDHPRHRSASDELRIPCRCLFRLPRADGLSGGSHLHPPRVCDCVDSVDRTCGELSATRRGSAVRVSGSGARAVRLPGALLLRVLLQGIHRPGDHDRLDPHALRGHATHGAYQVERGVRAVWPIPDPGSHRVLKGATPVGSGMEALTFVFAYVVEISV